MRLIEDGAALLRVSDLLSSIGMVPEDRVEILSEVGHALHDEREAERRKWMTVVFALLYCNGGTITIDRRTLIEIPTDSERILEERTNPDGSVTYSSRRRPKVEAAS